MAMKVHDIHAQSLQTSTALSGYYIPNFIPPLEAFRALSAERVRFILVGTHALGGWMREPRTTSDVDILVVKQHHIRAVRVLLAAFAQLRVEEHEDATRLRDTEMDRVLIDVMKPNESLFHAAFRHSHSVKWDGPSYRIPSLEMALVMKFAAMNSASRSYADKHIDAHDFICMARSNDCLNLRKLHTLGQLVYNGGGDEVVEMVRKVRAGEKLTL